MSLPVYSGENEPTNKRGGYLLKQMQKIIQNNIFHKPYETFPILKPNYGSRFIMAAIWKHTNIFVCFEQKLLCILIQVRL